MTRLIRRYALEGVLLLAAVLAIRTYQTRGHADGQAPQVEARLLDGTPVRLGEPGSAPVMLHFWASWCGVCRAEEGNVQALAKGGQILGVASRSGSSAEVQRYMQEHGLSFPVVNDPQGVIARKYGVQAYPSSFFLAADGSIQSSEVGYTTTLGLRLRLWLASL
jgi:thiol-disulfide isomerase/thioredoxin